MASSGITAAPSKMSFAKVAAMKAPTAPPRPTDGLYPESASRDANSRRSTVVRDHPQSPAVAPSSKLPVPQVVEHVGLPHSTSIGIEALSLVGKHLQPANGINGGDSGDSLGDDQSHLSTSSTKQHSFDTKSVASATTFAMDEKESIRPDDSASVRAADDEDGVSVVGRPSAFMQEPDVVMPALRGILPRSGGVPIHIASRRFQTLTHPPRFGDLESPPSLESETDEVVRSSPPDPSVDQANARMSAVPPSPDERLLDALASPKDRLSILQLEERILTFVDQSNLQFFDLPPQNSYARLLAHKLADYYGLNHHINDDGMTIRIFRGVPSSRPTSLATLATSIPIGSAQPPQGPTAVKIMRRSGMTSRQMSNNASTAPSSSAPSKATSEAGHSEEGLTSPTESTPGRDKSKMTREEREAQYKAVRERIFGDFHENNIGENASTGENSASMSRSSSSSGKKKSRRQKTPKDDSFEARSAFIPSYGPMPGMNSQGGYHQAPYMDGSMQNVYDNGQAYYGPPMNFGTTPTQAHPGFDSGLPTSPMGYGQEQGTWANVQQNAYYGFPQPPMRPAHPQMNPMAQPMNQYGNYASGPQSPQGWQAPQFPTSYQPQTNANPVEGNWMNYPGYGFGQQAPNPAFDGSNPAPPPIATLGNNNMNRSLFNPQTRSFIPSNSSSRTGSRSSSRKKTGGNSSGQPQARNNMRSPTTMQPGSLPFAPRGQDAGIDGTLEATEETLQKKYGTPANLPKKPPPSKVPSRFDHPAIVAVHGSNGSVNGRVGGGGAAPGEGASAPS